MIKKKLDIIYEDKELLVVNKKAHVLTVQTDKHEKDTLYSEVYDYLHKKNQKVFIVHRLDKDTSGVVVFAKNEKIKRALQEAWNDYCDVREYYAIVEGNVKETKGTIKQYLTENKTLHTYATDKEHGKLAITDFETIKASKNYSILKVTIRTGRKNQIRVALADMGHPIIGDKNYGSTKNPLRRMCLHHRYLKIKHPLKNHTFEFVSPVPSEFDIFPR